MKESILSTGRYLMVEVPVTKSGAQSHRTYGVDLLTFWNGFLQDSQQLPSGNWSIIGKGDEISDEQWDMIVEEKYGGFAGHIHGYKNYNRKFLSMDEAPLKTATESGHSWIRSNGFEPNKVLILKAKENE